MKINETKKAKFFYSDELNQSKFDVIYEKSVLIRDFKNQISSEIHSKITKFIDFSKFDAIKHFNTKIEGLNGQDIQNAVTDVWTMYSNDFDKIREKLTFKRKNVKSTKLQMVLTFLSKYGRVGIADSLIMPKNDNKKAIFFQEIKNYCEKFSENRLLEVALRKRKKYNQENQKN